MIDIFSVLEKNGVVGPRLDPPLDVKTPQQLETWARSKAGTAFHWMSTAPAGINSSVADEHFKVRGVTGLRVGSGASLPEIPGANPHLTITAFALALAYDVVKEWGGSAIPPVKPFKKPFSDMFAIYQYGVALDHRRLWKD